MYCTLADPNKMMSNILFDDFMYKCFENFVLVDVMVAIVTLAIRTVCWVYPRIRKGFVF